MITPGKREREKKRRERQAIKMDRLAGQAQARQDDLTAVWPPQPGTGSAWSESRIQAVIDDLVRVAGHQPKPTVRNYVRRIASNPVDLEAYRSLGVHLFTEGELDAALAVFDIVVREFPHHPVGPWKTAVCLRTNGDMPGFKEWMQRAWRRSLEMPRALDPAEREEFERDARLAGLAVPM